MYFYPYYIHFLNLFSFTHYNRLPPEHQLIVPTNVTSKNPRIPLFSITRYTFRKRASGATEYIAEYNYYTQLYSFNSKKFVSYNDLIEYVIKVT